MYSNLVNHIKRYVELNEEEIEILISCLKYRTVKKKEHILIEGQICKANYFVLKGCLRTYFINDKGIEQITHFAIENWWLSDYMSLDNQTASHFFIQAIENTTVVVLDIHHQSELFEKLPKLERYFRIILQKSYAASQFKLKFHFGLSGEERYHHFNNAFPQFIQRIPQYMLASYLGFTPEFLSKIRAKTT